MQDASYPSMSFAGIVHVELRDGKSLASAFGLSSELRATKLEESVFFVMSRSVLSKKQVVDSYIDTGLTWPESVRS